MNIKPALAYCCMSTKRLPGGEKYKTAITSFPGTPVYYLQKQEGSDIHDLYGEFNKFAKDNNCQVGWMLVLIGDFKIPFEDDVLYDPAPFEVRYSLHPTGFYYDTN
jgi:hypothetical protein